MGASAMEVGKRLVELCKSGEHRRAIEELYAEDAVAVEAMVCGPRGRETRGRNDLLAASDAFNETNEIHSSAVDGPYPFDDRFICFMSIDLTPRQGPMAGQRMQMKEACHYTVKDGKVTRSEFYYAVE